MHEKPATVLHHVRTLVRTGFLSADLPCPGPRSTVRPYRATDKSWTIDVGAPTGPAGRRWPRSTPRSRRCGGHPAPELGPLVLFSLRASRDQLEKLVTSLTEQLESVDEATEHTDEPVWNVLIATFPAAH